MNKKEWTLVENRQPGMYDCIQVYKEGTCYSLFRYIDDTDEDGYTIYEVAEYLNGISELKLKCMIGASDDLDVLRWVKEHLITERSNSLDAIRAFLDEHGIRYSRQVEYG